MRPIPPAAGNWAPPAKRNSESDENNKGSINDGSSQATDDAATKAAAYEERKAKRVAEAKAKALNRRKGAAAVAPASDGGGAVAVTGDEKKDSTSPTKDSKAAPWQAQVKLRKSTMAAPTPTAPTTEEVKEDGEESVDNPIQAWGQASLRKVEMNDTSKVEGGSSKFHQQPVWGSASLRKVDLKDAKDGGKGHEDDGTPQAWAHSSLRKVATNPIVLEPELEPETKPPVTANVEDEDAIEEIKSESSPQKTQDEPSNVQTWRQASLRKVTIPPETKVETAEESAMQAWGQGSLRKVSVPDRKDDTVAVSESTGANIPWKNKLKKATSVPKDSVVVTPLESVTGIVSADDEPAAEATDEPSAPAWGKAALKKAPVPVKKEGVISSAGTNESPPSPWKTKLKKTTIAKPKADSDDKERNSDQDSAQIEAPSAWMNKLKKTTMSETTERKQELEAAEATAATSPGAPPAWKHQLKKPSTTNKDSGDSKESKQESVLLTEATPAADAPSPWKSQLRKSGQSQSGAVPDKKVDRDSFATTPPAAWGTLRKSAQVPNTSKDVQDSKESPVAPSEPPAAWGKLKKSTPPVPQAVKQEEHKVPSEPSWKGNLSLKKTTPNTGKEPTAVKTGNSAVSAMSNIKLKKTTPKPKPKYDEILTPPPGTMGPAAGSGAHPPSAPPPAAAPSAAPQTANAGGDHEEDIEGPKVMILISNMCSTLAQRTNQDRALTMFRGKKIKHTVVDGTDPSQKETRNALFGISGIRGNYPQFFLVEGNEASIKYIGDFDYIAALNEMGQLSLEQIQWKLQQAEIDSLKAMMQNMMAQQQG